MREVDLLHALLIRAVEVGGGGGGAAQGAGRKALTGAKAGAMRLTAGLESA
jgi:hypothetical protein